MIEDGTSPLEFICKKCSLFLPATPDSAIIFNRFIENFKPDDIAITKPYGLFHVKSDSEYLKIIHGLKYHGFMRIGNEFGRELGKKIAFEKDCEYSGIVPVPIHHARLRERGFNQSLVIGKAVSLELNIPLCNLIKRIRYTPTQTILSKDERKLNLIDAIVPAKKQKMIAGNFLLIDDVLTTGSTINECATVLLEMGANRVDCAVLAVA